MLGVEMLTRVESLHSRGLLHRDIKPDNFLVGHSGRTDEIYMIDFGLSKRFKDMKTGVHIAYRNDKSLTGTARYASLNAHKGVEQSRRDDLEALGFVLIYFIRGGSLPWQGLKADRRSKKYDLIKEKKSKTSLRSLCRGQESCFYLYLHYARNLRFESKPDYGYLKQLFKDAMKKSGLEYDHIYDWSLGDSAASRPARDANSALEHPPAVAKKLTENDWCQEDHIAD